MYTLIRAEPVSCPRMRSEQSLCSLSTSPGSPTSPSPSSASCRCRRCSLLPLEECEPKEVSALFKFLRKRKVGGWWVEFQLLYGDP